MPKISEERVEERKNEILDACETLLKNTSIRNVTIKDIANYTSFSRPSIYNYFGTIEEIFLGLIEREYRMWNVDLRELLDLKLNREELASQIAHALEKRSTLLRILSANLFDIEVHSRVERLEGLTEALNETAITLVALFEKDLGASKEEYTDFTYIFFAFLSGAYFYTIRSKKQEEALDAIGVSYPSLSIYDIVNRCLLKILPNHEDH